MPLVDQPATIPAKPSMRSNLRFLGFLQGQTRLCTRDHFVIMRHAKLSIVCIVGACQKMTS
jgi:hypothetical protein